MTKIKICGVRSAQIARYAAEQGAAYIGLVFCKNSPRVVMIGDARELAQAAITAGAIPVGVFTQADAAMITEICLKTGITHVQLHGDRARNALYDLPSVLHKIYVMTPGMSDPGMRWPEHVLNYLRAEEDFILFDGETAGSGQCINWENIQLPAGLRFFLAGGLNAQNVQQAIHACHPFAVDVSSGVELSRGEKSPELIAQFIKTVSKG